MIRSQPRRVARGITPATRRRAGTGGRGAIPPRHTGQLLVPVEAKSSGLQHFQRLGSDLGTDAVTRYQRHIVGHGPGRTAAIAAFSAWSGDAPRPYARVRQSTLPLRESVSTSERSARICPFDAGPKPSAAGTSAKRPPTSATRLLIEERRGSGTLTRLGDRRIACPIWSGSSTTPAARRAIFRSWGGSTQLTSGLRAWNPWPTRESARSRAVRRSLYRAYSESDSSA